MDRRLVTRVRRLSREVAALRLAEAHRAAWPRALLALSLLDGALRIANDIFRLLGG